MHKLSGDISKGFCTACEAMQRITRNRYFIPAVSVLAPIVVIIILNLVFPLPYSKLNRPCSIATYSSNGELLSLYLSGDDSWRMKADLDEIPDILKKSVIEYEDKWFYYHSGINPASLIRAAITDITAGEVVCGGSTLTMQVARMMEPKPRTIKSKLIEILRASQLEFFLSKDQILEYYFNLAPYGGNIEGITAASYFYFNKTPSLLSKSEAIALVGLPNSPTRLRPDLHYEASLEHRNMIAKLMWDRKIITEREYLEIKSDNMPDRRFDRPANAPHFSNFLKKRNPGDESLVSTLDLRIQSKCENALRERLKPLLSYGITNGAVVVIDNKTRSVVAMAGSRDFDDIRHSGQVNGAIAPRSPGSALKPFVYAMALDEGTVSPALMLSDVPVNYGEYSPLNYDKKFRGGVAAEVALKQSLNVPVVNLHASMGDRFYKFLKQGGIKTLDKPWEHYRLPLVLGACEVNLLELTNLYSTFACGGNYQPYRTLRDEKVSKSERILSEDSCYIISEILSDVRRPDLPNCWEFSMNLPKIAWKTGTSFGQRDAWSIGYNRDYTVGVWVGNFSGRESKMLVGSDSAAPILFDIFNAINTTDKWFEKTENVGTRKVCSISGMLPRSDCPQTRDELFIQGVSPIRQCEMHKKFAIDSETGLRLTMSGRSERKFIEKPYEIWPSDIASWRIREGYPVDAIPGLLEESSGSSNSGNPIILSPSQGLSVRMRRDTPLEHQGILLEASASNTVSKIFWFVDDELVTGCSPEERSFYYPAPGQHHIMCIDNFGNSSSVEIEVKG